MKAVFDPKGGYFKAGGVYMPSLVAELGMIVEDRLKTIGLMHDPDMSDAQRALIAEKRRAYEENRSKKKPDLAATAPAAREEDVEVTGDGVSFPPSATMCHKCHTKAIVIMDGCATCFELWVFEVWVSRPKPIMRHDKQLCGDARLFFFEN